jgi:hypothetical protein
LHVAGYPLVSGLETLRAWTAIETGHEELPCSGAEDRGIMPGQRSGGCEIQLARAYARQLLTWVFHQRQADNAGSRQAYRGKAGNVRLRG